MPASVDKNSVGISGLLALNAAVNGRENMKIAGYKISAAAAVLENTAFIDSRRRKRLRQFKQYCFPQLREKNASYQDFLF